MPQYVTKKDYFDHAGIDLDIELKKSNSDNPSKAVDIFLTRVENWMMMYLKTNYLFSDTDFNERFDATAFKNAVLYQIDYIRRQGDITIDNPDKVRVISQSAFMTLKMAGMCNTTLPKVTVTDPWV